MEVRANKRGFYGVLREVGSVFEIEPADRGSWMDVIDTPKPKSTKRKKKVANGK